jgi:predicted RNA-binding protein
MDNEEIERFINMKISFIKRELITANRYWKADLIGQLQAYEDMKQFLNGVKQALRSDK